MSDIAATIVMVIFIPSVITTVIWTVISIVRVEKEYHEWMEDKKEND